MKTVCLFKIETILRIMSQWFTGEWSTWSLSVPSEETRFRICTKHTFGCTDGIETQGRGFFASSASPCTCMSRWNFLYEYWFMYQSLQSAQMSCQTNRCGLENPHLTWCGTETLWKLLLTGNCHTLIVVSFTLMLATSNRGYKLSCPLSILFQG